MVCINLEVNFTQCCILYIHQVGMEGIPDKWCEKNLKIDQLKTLAKQLADI